MSVTLAVAAVRLARMDTLVQQMSATESLAAVDTICVDKTGTLTDGTLELIDVVSADPDRPGDAERALGRFAASAGERNRTLETIAEAFPEHAAVGHGRGSLLVALEVERADAERGRAAAQLRRRRARRARRLGRAHPLACAAEPSRCGGGPGPARRRLRRGARWAAGRPGHPATAASRAGALVVLEETLRPDAAETIEFMREQEVDLKLISGDARQTVTAVAYALGVDRRGRRRSRAPTCPPTPLALARVAEDNTIFCRITPDQKKALVGALSDSGRFTAMIGDGVNDVPALKQARLAVAMGSGSQITKGIADIVLLRDQFSMLPRAIAEGRRIARNIHRLGPPLPDQDRLRRVPDRRGFADRLHLPVPASSAHCRRAADDRHPLLRPRARARARGRSTAAGCSARSPPSRFPPGSASASVRCCRSGSSTASSAAR